MQIFKKRYAAAQENIRQVHKDIKHALHKLDFSPEDQDCFLLGASEIFTNALKHVDPAPEEFHVLLEILEDTLVFQLMDDGPEFEDFEEKLKQSQTRNLETIEGALEEAGLGLSLAEQSFDDFSYKRVEGWNHYVFSCGSPFAEKKPIILLVDDDPLQRMVFETYLEDFYDIAEVDSGKAALRWLEDCRQKPDLILCDVIMSDGNGVDFCQSLQDKPDFALIPFVFVTGNTRHEMAKMAENLPVSDFLKKPVKEELLLKTVARILKRNQQDRNIMGRRLDRDITSVLSPCVPEKIGSYKTALRWKAAEAGGGDALLHLKGGECDHIILMDIMGHGVQAKFFSHVFAGYLYGFLSAHSNIQDPGEILQSLSAFLMHDKMGKQTFLTAQILSIFQDGTVKIASAGHPAPFLVDEQGLAPLEVSGSMPGLALDAKYETIDISLRKNQRLVLYTDGLVEVGNNAKDMKSHAQALKNQIAQSSQEGLHTAADRIWNYFLEASETTPRDDSLLLMLQSV